MILSDLGIKELVRQGILKVEPYDEGWVDSCSLTLRLAPLVIINKASDKLDTYLFSTQDRYIEKVFSKLHRVDFSNESPFEISPGQTVYGCTYEKIVMPKFLLGRVCQKWSLTQYGLVVTSQSGLLQPNSEGSVRLSLTNLSPVKIALYPWVPICQVVFEEIKESVETPYNSGKSRYLLPYV